MKVCPACNTQYSDDTLRFCLQDGTPLVEPFDPALPTVVIGGPEVETETQARRIDVPATEEVRSVPPPRRPPVVDRPEKGRSRTPVTIIATVLGVLLLLSIGGLAAWLYLSNRRTEVANSTAAPNTQVINTNIN